MSERFQFNRMEVAGSLGDLGTLLPMLIGMILINGMDPIGLLVVIGLYYVASGLYFGVTVPVQPMKVIGAYAIATGLPAQQIFASGIWMAGLLFLIGVTGLIDVIGRAVPKAVIRGVQLSTGTLLMAEGTRFILGRSKFQLMGGAAEPYLDLQRIGGIPIGILLGILAGGIVMRFMNDRRFPAGLLVVVGGAVVGLLLGTHEGLAELELGIHLPRWLPFGWPAYADWMTALFVLALPQLPMTVGNAVVADADLSKEYFGQRSHRVTYRALTISMAIANLASAVLGGMPLCHGAGGLAAHYRFGARTAGSNLFIGAVFILLGLLLGFHALAVIYLLPMAILGVMLLFAGSQLALTVIDLNARKDLFVAFMILGITLAANLAVGFVIGTALAYALKSDRLDI
ncbi:MAG: sulfate permease [Desulfobacteraceae bacterium]|nr:sulfate permease [Desulfobacteraceae bacterium]MBC2751592.1 sulfate permease [Desulfobacteraceae bacterium]